MPSAELRRLFKLYQIDQALLEIRKRAAALDPGRKTAAEIQLLEKQAADSPAKTLQRELHDLELQQKSLDDKVKKFDRELYGGKVVNPREVEAIEKEIGILKRHRGDIDERILLIWEELPNAQANLEKIEQALEQRREKLTQEQKAARASKAVMQAEFDANSKSRPAAAKELPPTLLARYEGIRQKHGGVGLAQVSVRNGTCGACGTKLPTRTIEALKEDKIVTCESCHRILYYTEGVV